MEKKDFRPILKKLGKQVEKDAKQKQETAVAEKVELTVEKKKDVAVAPQAETTKPQEKKQVSALLKAVTMAKKGMNTPHFEKPKDLVVESEADAVDEVSIEKEVQQQLTNHSRGFKLDDTNPQFEEQLLDDVEKVSESRQPKNVVKKDIAEVRAEIEKEFLGSEYVEPQQPDNYRVGDIGRSIRQLKQQKLTRNTTLAEESVERVDYDRVHQAKQDMDDIISSLETMKAVSSLDRDTKNYAKQDTEATLEDKEYQSLSNRFDILAQLEEERFGEQGKASDAIDVDQLTGDLGSMDTSKKPSYSDAEAEEIRNKILSLVQLGEYRKKKERKYSKYVPYDDMDLNEEMPATNPIETDTNTINQDQTDSVEESSEYGADLDFGSAEALSENVENLYGEVYEVEAQQDTTNGQGVDQASAQKEEKKNFVTQDAKETKKFAWLAYILFFIPLLINRHSAYVKHSCNEGLEINFVDLIGIVFIACGAFIDKVNMSLGGVLIGLLITGIILLVMTTVTKIFMIAATLKGKYVKTPWFWDIEIIR